MTTTIELIQHIEMIGSYFDNAKLKEAAQRLRELDAQVTELELKLLTELEAQLEAAKNQWQPIETAPKDGEEILVMYVHIDTQIVHNGFWLEDAQDPDSTGWWTYLRSEVAREKLEGWRAPRYWMQLPAIAEGKA